MRHGIPMDMNIQLAMISDANYLDFAAITLTSILYHHRGGGLTVHMIHPLGMQEEKLEKIRQLQKIAPFDFNAIPVDPGQFERKWGVSKPTWWRCELPSLCPQVRKMLYLDCDMIVLDDIEKLWSEALGEAVIGAVGDRLGLKVAATLKMPVEQYFNAGMLLMDLETLRKENAEDTMRETLKRRGDDIHYADQDLLNICFWERTRMLGQRWNIINSVYRNLPVTGMYSVEEVKEALASPGIVHFTGHHKPWLFWKTVHHPYAERFWHYTLLSNCSSGLKVKMFLKQHLMNIWVAPKHSLPWDRSILKQFEDDGK